MMHFFLFIAPGGPSHKNGRGSTRSAHVHRKTSAGAPRQGWGRLSRAYWEEGTETRCGACGVLTSALCSVLTGMAGWAAGCLRPKDIYIESGRRRTRSNRSCSIAGCSLFAMGRREGAARGSIPAYVIHHNSSIKSQKTTTNISAVRAVSVIAMS